MLHVLLCLVSVYVAEMILDKQNLEHAAIPIAKKNVVFSSCSQYNKFS